MEKGFHFVQCVCWAKLRGQALEEEKKKEKKKSSSASSPSLFEYPTKVYHEIAGMVKAIGC